MAAHEFCCCGLNQFLQFYTFCLSRGITTDMTYLLILSAVEFELWVKNNHYNAKIHGVHIGKKIHF